MMLVLLHLDKILINFKNLVEIIINNCYYCYRCKIIFLLIFKVILIIMWNR